MLNASVAVGQTTTGEISGTVRDTSGAILPGVTITVTNDLTGIATTVTTSGEGQYVTTNLPVGLYRVRAELQGFRPAERTGLDLAADARLTADFRLALGTFSEVVDVEAVKGESANRASGEIARVIDGEQIRELALNGRNYMELATLIPGSVQLEDDWIEASTSLSASNQSINGNRGNNSTLTVDGAYNLDTGSQGTQINNVGIDFIEQVSIQTSNFSSRFGRNAGAAINVVTKSGTNRYRGSLFEFYRNDRFDSANHFAVRDLATGRRIKAALDYHNYGGSFGGPIVKGKFFFFAGVDKKQIDQDTQPFRRSLPSLAELSGDFSMRLAGADGIPGTSDDGSVPDQLVDPITRQPFAGNVIPADRITPEGRKLADVYRALIGRALQYNDRPIGNNATYQPSIPFDLRQEMLRFDYRFNASHRTSVRVLHDKTEVVRASTSNSDNLLYRELRDRPGSSYQLAHTWSVSKTLLAEGKLSASWHRQRYTPYDDTWRRATYGLDLPQFFPDGGGLLPDGIPNVSVSGFAGVVGANGLQISPSVDITPEATVTWVKQRHTLIAGTRVTRVRKDQNAESAYLGTWTFDHNGNNASTGYGMADMLMGRFRRYSEASADPVAFYRFTQPAAYISDTWRVRSNLSVEAGVRYEYMQPTYAAQNNLTNFLPELYDPAQAVIVNRNGSLVQNSGNRFNGLIRAGGGVPPEHQGRTSILTGPEYDRIPVGAPRGFYSTYHVFMPRLSASYSLNAATVLRGGVGVFYDRPEINLVYRQGRIPPFAGSVQVENGSVTDPTGGRPSNTAVMGDIVAVDPNLDVPRQTNYSVSVQRELPRGLFVEAAYVGNRGSHLLRTVDINAVPFETLAANQALPSAERANVNSLRPYKGYAEIQQRRSDARSQYHALQLYGTKRRGNATMTASYTLGRVLANANGTTEIREDAWDESFIWGPASFDRRHVAVFTYRYRLPFFAERKDLLAQTLGGWEVSGVTRYQSGSPITIDSDTAPLDDNRRADYLGGDVRLPGDQRGAERWFDTSAFAIPPLERRGTALYGQVRGPELYTWNLSFRKRVALAGQSRLSVQIDAFNLFNRVNLRNPENTVTDADFGAVESAAPARQFAFGARFEF